VFTPLTEGKSAFMRTAGGFSILLLTGMLSPVEPVKPMGARVIEPLDYRGVVFNDGPLLRQVLEVRCEVRDLPAGRHTIRLTLLAEKNPASRDRYANVTGFDVAGPTGNSTGSLPGAVIH
jgi:hypothetical protein